MLASLRIGIARAVAGDRRRLLAVGLALLLTGCATLRSDIPKRPSQALAADPATPLGLLAAERLRSVDEASAFRLLESGRAALAARLAMVEQARQSVDLQYYIFHGDTAGKLLVDALLRAADRGVRVRVLLDDMYTAENEAAIIGLDAHRNIQIRLYNPFHIRGNVPLGRLAEFLDEHERLNRRMHNKLFIVDNHLGITGGRNIGDEYFQLEDPRDFLDLDVLAIGRVVPYLSAAFDAYWNAESSVPARALPKPESPRTLLREARRGVRTERSERRSELVGYLGLDVLGGQAGDGFGQWAGGEAELLVDAPDKTLSRPQTVETPAERLLARVLETREELLISSPYFVPGRRGLEVLGLLRARGVAVTVLTNSLAANDVAMVHAGYSRYRVPLLQAGVGLHELKPLKNRPLLRSGRGLGSSRASLHSKALVLDRSEVYIGSMNLDPRSVLLNTESGLVIHSPRLAAEVAAFIKRAADPENSYRVRLDTRRTHSGPHLVWEESRAGESIRHDVEPRTGFWLRLLLHLLALLPIEEQL